MNMTRMIMLSLLALIQAPAWAQNVNLTLDEGNCAIPMEASASVVMQTDGSITVDVDDAKLPECFSSGSGNGTIPTVTLNVNPTNINAGESVTVTWSVDNFTSGVTVCQASGGFGTNWVSDVTASPASGSEVYTPSSSTNFELACSNGPNDVTRSVTVNGGGGGGFPQPPPADCSSAEPPPGGVVTQQSPFSFNLGGVSGSGTTYHDVFGPWPGQGGITAFIFVPRNKYIAAAFKTTTTPNDIMTFAWVGGPNVGNGFTVSISRCPGDFGVHLSQQRCIATGGSEGGQINAIVGTNANACDLQADTQYYFNIISATPTNLQESLCPAGNSQCNFIGSP